MPVNYSADGICYQTWWFELEELVASADDTWMEKTEPISWPISASDRVHVDQASW